MSASSSNSAPSGAASAASKQSGAAKSDTSVTAGTVRRVETILLDIDEEDEAWEAEVRMVSEAYDLTYSDEDTDWVIFKKDAEDEGDHMAFQTELGTEDRWK